MSKILNIHSCIHCTIMNKKSEVCPMLSKKLNFDDIYTECPKYCPLPDYEQLIEQIQMFEKHREKQRHINNTFETRLSSLEILIDKVNEYFQQHVQDCHRSQSRGCE